MIKDFIQRLINKISSRATDKEYNLVEEKKDKDEFNKEPDKVLVMPCKLENEEDVKSIQNSIRELKTILLINTNSKKDDVVELKRLIKPIKMTIDAVGGNIASFGDGWIVTTPNFVGIRKSKVNLNKEDDA